MSLLLVSHGHPRFACGGGELAAWRLFEQFRDQPGFEGSGFLAAASSAEVFPAGCEVVGLTEDQWLIKRSPNPIFHDTAVSLRDGSQLHEALRHRDFRLIHLHHYLHVGLDLVQALRRWFPQAKLILTLHDYWGPCVFEGRLLRRSGELCSGGDPEACDACLGGDRRGELAIREWRLKRLFAVVDHCLSPSFFLKRCYLQWGVDPRRISVVENLPAPATPSAEDHQLSTRPGLNQQPLVLGYFGQINPWKGLDRILQALVLLQAKESGAPRVRLDVHGPLPQDQDSAFWMQCLALIDQLGPERVTLCGGYAPEHLAARMAAVDWVVMASIWYENSPMVIQEAYRHGRPVLAPRLGGMAEKVRHGISGWLFEPDAIENLVEAIQCLCQLPQAEAKALQRGAASMAIGSAQAGERHARLYCQWLQ
jgi:glycosyltransferase involved in cell wall biosynthesis